VLLRSWVASANDPLTDFPLNNLPCGVFSVDGDAPRCGVAIGDMILDCQAAEAAGLIRLGDDPVFDVPFWNEVMEAGPQAWDRLRARLISILLAGSKAQRAAQDMLVPLDRADLHLPFLVAEFTDFYASRHHAGNVGTMFRGAAHALPPNWLHMPIGYNGRASTVVVSGTPLHRPNGQVKAPEAALPEFHASQRLDYELELGAVVGQSSQMGQPVTVAQADAMIFGYVLLNDWSARDIQAWEYQPLGPFQSKAFATTISPWIVTRAALAPFRVAGPQRELPLLPYLQEPGPMLYDIDLAVDLQVPGQNPHRICRTNYREMYYSAAQQITHHASSGCAMTAGDLIGSGTVSGPGPDARGSLLELTSGGAEPLILPFGLRRPYLEDGDKVILTGHAAGDGYRVGFGDCSGTILPARRFPAG